MPHSSQFHNIAIYNYNISCVRTDKHYKFKFLNIKCGFGLKWKIKVILLFTVFFDTIHEPTLLLQLVFTFIYNNFNYSFLISAK